MRCKYCGNDKLVKNGTNYNTQRYKCKECKKTFVLNDNRIKHPLLLRKLALAFYLSGTSMRGIQRALKVCFNVNIYIKNIEEWLKNSNNILLQEQSNRKQEKVKQQQIEILEMDELYTYIKKNQEIQKQTINPILIKEYGLLLIGIKANQ